MREGKITSYWTDLVQSISQRVALDDIEIRYTWFPPDIKDYYREIPTRVLIVALKKSKSDHIITARTTSTREPGEQERVSIWGDQMSSFRRSLKQIQSTKSSFHSSMVQRAQWDVIFWGRKSIKKVYYIRSDIKWSQDICKVG